MIDPRISNIDRFTSGMADIQITRHPLRSLVIVVFNDTTYDVYKDGTTVETERINKLAIVERDKDLMYVQELLGDEFLIDEDERNPWIVTMTTTGLTRTLKGDDVLIIDGNVFTVSKLKPINKRIQSVITLLVYPENTNFTDAFKLDSLIITKDEVIVESLYINLNEVHVIEIVYGGLPLFYSSNYDVEDLESVVWTAFVYKFLITPISEDPINLAIRSADLTIETLEIQ